MNIEIHCAVPAGACVGEGAIWSVADQALYWCDIMGPANDGRGVLHRHDPATGANSQWTFDEPLGCFAQARSGRFVLALSTGFYGFDPSTGERELVGGPDVTSMGHRFNDGSVDPGGRFYGGTMELGLSADRKDNGVLYSLDQSGSRTVMDGFFIINGMAFTPDGKTAYISDSFAPRRTIWAYDYDLTDGAWTNQRLFFDTSQVRGRPDGATLDSDGCYWMAGVSGWQLVRITPEGKVDMTIDMPVEKPSRPAFGGKDMKTLFVTSLSEGLTAGTDQPLAGGLFALEVPGVQGVAFPQTTAIV